ncbi:PAS domain-containing sensor histidine kinase [Methylobacterium sp. WSM2598]|uniref:PAS domain-containing sensor histidine kinase n=1 Tax=Methylobacterium sp. WSM2598 TaxID=398261 RepID=UPI00036B5F95|nr:PAS domain-containing sensor histidine kinase [Methylobacterium sp. WSM2598]
MRINKALATLIDARLAGLVHDSVSEESGERGRHERFLISRLATGAVSMALLPPYLLWRGVPSLLEAGVAVCLMLPVVAAFLLARTGRLTPAHALSAAAHAGFIVCLAQLTGGPVSAATLWLALIPIEALMAGTHRAAIAAAGIAAAAAVAIACLDPPAEPPLAWSAALAMPVFAVTAICHVLSLALEFRRREGSWNDRLQQASARNALLLDVIDDLVTWHDRGGGVVQASRGALRLAGAAPQTLLGRGLLGRIHVQDRPAFLKAISDAGSLDGPVTVQVRLHTDLAASGEAGRVIWVEMRAHRVPPGARAGAPHHSAVVAVTRDVSEQRRHAEEMERARAEAERADAVKSRFLAVVSHELRTPLNAIIGFSEMLSAEANLALPPERQREYAAIIHGSGRHLLEVVNALLDLTKIQSGSFDFAPEPFDLRALVNGCCDLMQLRADQGGIELMRDVPRDLPELTADPRACRQMLINLLSNAVKFTPRGGRITVAVRAIYDRIEMSVTDTGVGIAEADLPRLGDPFFQAGDSAAYARMHEGTGLGLSVVRGLVGLHDGELLLESSVARGTRVVVVLPLDCRGGPRSGGPVPIRTAPLAEPGAVPLLRAS